MGIDWCEWAVRQCFWRYPQAVGRKLLGAFGAVRRGQRVSARRKCVPQPARSLAASRRFTGSGNRADTSPPSPATSFASDDDTNEYCGVVATKKVSTPAMCLFICAICSSYSKSVPVRRPLTIAVKPRDFTKSTTSPWPASTRRFGRCSHVSSIVAMRSSTVNMPALLGLTRTATITSSNWAAARSKTSTCPSVTGSKDPGQTAPLMDDDAIAVPRPLDGHAPSREEPLLGLLCPHEREEQARQDDAEDRRSETSGSRRSEQDEGDDVHDDEHHCRDDQNLVGPAAQSDNAAPDHRPAQDDDGDRPDVVRRRAGAAERFHPGACSAVFLRCHPREERADEAV